MFLVFLSFEFYCVPNPPLLTLFELLHLSILRRKHSCTVRFDENEQSRQSDRTFLHGDNLRQKSQNNLLDLLFDSCKAEIDFLYNRNNKTANFLRFVFNGILDNFSSSAVIFYPNLFTLTNPTKLR